ncbi:MAG TPA: porin [Ramlibacter sp.]|nr:porin [Ramlibacter sp.]
MNTRQNETGSMLMGAMVAAIASLAAGPALAQSAVTIYGIVDTGVESVTNVGPTRSRVTRMPSLTGSLPSRLGYRGSEDLGNGYSGVFVLEQGFAPDTGALNQSGRAFGRQAYVGLGTPWGTLSLGRQYSQIFYSLIGDTMGPNIYTASLLDTYLANARWDNSIAWRGSFGPVTAGATYSLGRDTVAPVPAGGCAGESTTDSKACRGMSAALQYATQQWGVALALDRQVGGAGAGSPLPSSSQTDSRASLSGFTRMGAVRLGAGLIRRNNEASPAPRSDFWFLGGNYALGPWLFDAQYGRINVRSSADDASVVSMRAMYNFSRRSAAYVTLGRMINRGNATFTIDGGVPAGSAPAPGVDQTGFMVGIRHSF